MVIDGTVRRNAKARVLRDGNVVADNLDLASLKREKDDASEVREGFECGLVLKNFQDIKIGDVVESFEMREIPRGCLHPSRPLLTAKVAESAVVDLQKRQQQPTRRSS